jgi:uncharacterized protein YbbC (DUF1343 family)
MKLKTGIEILKETNFKQFKGKSLGLLSNHASVDKNFILSADIFSKASRRGLFKLAKLFGPQQGFFETQQANMSEWEESRFGSRWGVPIHSLYGKTRIPTEEMLSGINTFVVDLQDVGAKGYTFISTLYYLMEQCEKRGIEIVVLDRPNPAGSFIEGPVTQDSFTSFVGIHNLPLRHGLTIGEASNLFRNEKFGSIKLSVIKMKGYSKKYNFEEIAGKWLPTSPNLPTLDSVILYSGMELLEGTSLSEGRGTTRPFEQCGAPYIDPFEFSEALNARKLPGVRFRPVSFTPVFDKWKEKECYGIFIHITDWKRVKSVRTAVEIIAMAIKMYKDSFSFNLPPYEYETEKLPFDILAGNSCLREMLLSGKDPVQIEKSWKIELSNYSKRTKKIQLY